MACKRGDLPGSIRLELRRCFWQYARIPRKGSATVFDEIGIVVDQYFLATTTPEDDEIIYVLILGMPSSEMKE